MIREAKREPAMWPNWIKSSSGQHSHWSQDGIREDEKRYESNKRGWEKSGSVLKLKT